MKGFLENKNSGNFSQVGRGRETSNVFLCGLKLLFCYNTLCYPYLFLNICLDLCHAVLKLHTLQWKPQKAQQHETILDVNKLSINVLCNCNKCCDTGVISFGNKTLPLLVVRSTSTVGLPRLSKICLAWSFVIVAISMEVI